MSAAYPLSWPEGFPRTRTREAGRFKTTLPAALENVTKSLKMFGSDSGLSVRDIVLSSNVTLGTPKPADPGVAVWFIWDNELRCIAVDRYQTVQDNLQAIHHVLEARRTELRHGTLALVRAAMSGLKALPAPPGKGWRAVLEMTATTPTRESIIAAYKRLATIRHPDKPGGSHKAMAELNAARDAALSELG